MLKKVTEGWQERADHIGLSAPGDRPISTNCVVADSDEEARETARGYMAKFLNFRQIITKQTQTPTGKVLRDTSNFPRLLVI